MKSGTGRAGGARDAAGSALRAGVGKADITARAGERAYGRYTEQAMVHIPRELWDKRVEVDDPLFVKALVLDDGADRMALLTMDTTAVACRTTSQNILDDSADDFTANLRARLSKEFGIAPANVSVCASHTHPPGRILCGDGEQLDRAFRAVEEALRSMAPVVAGVGSTRDDRLAVNRTCRMKNGRHACGCPPDDEIAGVGPVDPEIGVIRIDRLDGRPLAVVYHFGCHIFLGSPDSNISAGFPAVASALLEEALGGGAMAFFIQGTLGDVMELRVPGSACETGLMLGQTVLAAHGRIKPALTGFRMVSATVDFPLRRDIPDVIAELRRQQAEDTAGLLQLRLNVESFLSLYAAHALRPAFPSCSALRYLQNERTGDRSLRAADRSAREALKRYVDNMRRMEALACAEFKIRTLAKHREIIDTLGGATVPAEIQGIALGDSVFIMTPMEVLTDVGLNVKKSSPFPHTYVVSIANGYLHYSPPASYYPLGSYEATECLLAPEWEAIFMEAVREMLRTLRHAPGSAGRNTRSG